MFAYFSVYQLLFHLQPGPELKSIFSIRSKAFLLRMPSLLRPSILHHPPCVLRAYMCGCVAGASSLRFCSVLDSWISRCSLSFSHALMECSLTPCFWFSTASGALPLGFCSRNCHLSHPQLCTTHPAGSLVSAFSAKPTFTHWRSILQNLVAISLGGFWVHSVFIPYCHFIRVLGGSRDIYTCSVYCV